MITNGIADAGKRAVALVVLVAVLPSLAACKDDSPPAPAPTPRGSVPPPSLSGLELVPDDARAVVGLDLAALRESAPARALVTAVLERDRELRAMAAAWRKRCGRAVIGNVSSAVVALGPAETEVMLAVEGAPGTDELIACASEAGAVADDLAADGGRPVFRLRGASGPLWLAYGRPGSAVLARDRDWLRRGLSRGVKVSENDRMLELLARVDRARALWFVARVPSSLAASLVEATDGEVAEGPLAVFGSFDAAESRVDLVLEMASASDARAAETFWRQQRDALVTLAQGVALGPLIGRIRTRVRDARVEAWAVIEPVDVERLATASNDAASSPAPGRAAPPAKRRKQH